MIKDNVGAFMPNGQFTIKPNKPGSLDGLTFAVKDLFHIAGHKTSAGNPTWLETHDICENTSPAVLQLLDNGATCVGKVLTDEMAFSLNGDNIHYGTPINSNAIGRVTGGSSNGSAAAVAAKLCDFALATDTGGSTRVPASYCGIWGMRTTHGLISAKHMVPLHPSFDTVNWFANDLEIFDKVGQILLGDLSGKKPQFNQIKISNALWQLANADFQPALLQITNIISEILKTKPIECKVTMADESLDDWRQAYVDFGASEVWAIHGDWVENNKPVFSPPITERFTYAKNLTKAQREQAWHMMQKIRSHMQDIITENTIMILPSSASTALPINSQGEAVDFARRRTLQITSIASITGLPQLSIPMRNNDNIPFGISILGPKNSDLALIALAKKIMEKL